MNKASKEKELPKKRSKRTLIRFCFGLVFRIMVPLLIVIGFIAWSDWTSFSDGMLGMLLALLYCVISAIIDFFRKRYFYSFSLIIFGFITFIISFNDTPWKLDVALYKLRVHLPFPYPNLPGYPVDGIKVNGDRIYALFDRDDVYDERSIIKIVGPVNPKRILDQMRRGEYDSMNTVNEVGRHLGIGKAYFWSGHLSDNLYLIRSDSFWYIAPNIYPKQSKLVHDWNEKYFKHGMTIIPELGQQGE